MVHSLGLHVVAERVEHDLQLQVLQSLKCNSIQGYYFSKPVPREQATALLANPSNIRRKVWAAESSDMSVKKQYLQVCLTMHQSEILLRKQKLTFNTKLDKYLINIVG